jgi:DNA-binding NarL/FixJ family response regulator
MTKLRIFLADDHPVVRFGLKDFLQSQSDMEVIGEAWDGETAVTSALSLRPDVVVMDVSMPGMPGHEATKRIRAENPDIKVLALTGHEDRGYMQLALSAGAQGYVPKRAATHDLVRAIRAVASGELFIDPSVREDFTAIMQPQPTTSPTQLSDREEEVLRSIAQGHLLKQIANRLGVGLRTVETYKVRAMEKIGLKSRADIIRHALRCGWLTPQ